MTLREPNADKTGIDELTERFFRAFGNKDGRTPDLDSLHELFVASALITKNVGRVPEFYNVDEFIEPRRALLTDGRLTDFEEHELAERTDIFGGIAQRFCLYEKSGVQLGQPFRTRGVKSLQFVRTAEGWKIAAAAWDDERENQEIDLNRW
jgi:hypothetical protein